MHWFYVENEERQGPVDEATFHSLVQAGRILPETLVWREGLAEWQPYRAIRNQPDASGEAPCVECGRRFPVAEMVQYEGSSVCAECKPLFFQKIKEGLAPTTQGMIYGGFWFRFLAKFVDGIVLQIANFFLQLPAVFLFPPEQNAGLFLFINLTISIGLSAAYSIFFTGKFGATPGKMAVQLKVVRPDGSPIGYGLATGRFFAEWLSSLTLLIGYIMAAFDDEKRTLHDRICNTRVIRRNR